MVRRLRSPVSTVLYSANVLCPMSGPPIGDGAVLVSGGTIMAVGTRSDLRPSADREHHVDGVLLPGLVDGHTLAEHSDVRAIAQPGPFAPWVRAVQGYTTSWDPERWMRSAHRGVLDALRHGVTATVDSVVRGPGVPAAGRAQLAGHSLVQIAFVDAEEQDAVLPAVEAALSRDGKGRTIGLAPHSPYTLGTGVLQALVTAAEGRPLQIKAAESNAEVAALRNGDGPLAELAAESGLDAEWLDGGAGLGPVGYLEAVGALRPGTTLAHAVWVDLAEARRLAATGTGVVVCPRANGVLGVGDAPVERFADAGVGLALGTGGPAAVGDADLLADVAAWVALAERRELLFWPSAVGPISLAEAAVRLATVEGARTLGLGDVAGILERGRRADLVGVSIATGVETVYRDLADRGAGRQVLTVVDGVRRARREDPDEPWPTLEEWKDL